MQATRLLFFNLKETERNLQVASFPVTQFGFGLKKKKIKSREQDH